MKKIVIQWDGTDDLFLLSAQANGFTGFVQSFENGADENGNIIRIPIINEQTVDEFMCLLVKKNSVNFIVENTLSFLEKKYGTDNYNIEEKRNEVMSLINIYIL